MSTKLIRLADDILIEVEADPSAPQKAFGGQIIQKVEDVTLDAIKHVLERVVDATRVLQRDKKADEAEIEFGLSFEAEGNVYVTKLNGTANLTVKLIFKSS